MHNSRVIDTYKESVNLVAICVSLWRFTSVFYGTATPPAPIPSGMYVQSS